MCIRDRYSPLQLSTKKFNALSWILPLLLLLWSAFFDMSHPYNEVDVKDIITIADLTPHEVLTYYSQYSNHIGPIFEEVKIYSESSSLHQLDFKSFKTSSSQLQMCIRDSHITHNYGNQSNLYTRKFVFRL